MSQPRWSSTTPGPAAGLQQPRECLLHGVLSRTDIAQHPERQVDQVRPVRLPCLDDLGIFR
jgi:hypothetical protein